VRRVDALRCMLVIVLAPLVGRAQNTISTIVGGGTPLGNGTALTASLGSPTGVVVDASGNTYVTSLNGEYVFKIDASSNITILGGTGFAGFIGVGGKATSATLSGPAGLAFDSNGNLLVADFFNQHVYGINLTTGVLTNVAGSATPANPLGGFGGDGGLATQALLNTPLSVAVFNTTMYIADTGNNRIRAVTNGTITTIAGNGTVCSPSTALCGDNGPATKASLNFGNQADGAGIAVDGVGNLYIPDSSDNRVRKVDTTGMITTIAGTGMPCLNPGPGNCGDGGAATLATLNLPAAVFVSGGNIYIADEFDEEIRLVNVDGQISTVAGDGIFGFSGDGGAAVSAALSDPVGVFVDGNGNLFIADDGNNRIREVTSDNQIINPFAGGGSGGDGGPPLNSNFSYAYDLALDAANNQFIIDFGTSRIREVTGGVITTVAGSGTAAYSGDGGAPTSATLDYPRGVALGAGGKIFIADSATSVVRLVQGGVITTYAGVGFSTCSPSTGVCGDGGPANSASLNTPNGVAVDSNGNLFIADTGDNRIRRVDTAFNISTVAGTGVACAAPPACGDGGQATLAQLNSPTGIAVDAADDLFIADSGDNLIRRVDGKTQVITTVAFDGQATFSGDGGLATLASMSAPNKVAVDPAGNLYIGGGLDNVVRRVDFATQTIATVAGNAKQPLPSGFSGDGGPATSATLSNRGLAINATGGLYIADNNRIRFVQLSPVSVPAPANLDFGNQTVGVGSKPLPVTLTNSGSDDLLISSIVDANGFSQTNNCPIAPAPLAPLQFCTINITFTPLGPGTENDTLIITDNAAGSPQTVPLTGVGQPAASFATLAPANLNFNTPQLLGTTSTAQPVKLSNTGTGPLTITSIGFTGANASEFGQTNNCGSSLAVNASCTVSVTFSPTVAGTAAAAASLTVTDNAPGSPQAASLAGTVQSFSLTTTCTSLSVVPGQSAIYTVDLAPVNGFTQSVALSCSGAPTLAKCTVNPSSMTLDGATTVQAKVTATTTPPTSGFLKSPFNGHDGNRMAGVIGLAGMAGLAAFVMLPGKSRVKHAGRLCGLIFCLCLLASVATMSSCGVGGGNADPPGTAAGTYPLTVTGTFKSAAGTTFTEKVGFNLVVK
jgi:sugar lactone lactonase YvrE